MLVDRRFLGNVSDYTINHSMFEILIFECEETGESKSASIRLFFAIIQL